MKWLDASLRMENHIIKKDSTSTNSDYFMATHVPFQNLEFIASGSTGLAPTSMSEEDIYQSFFVRHAAHHQMIMVRGTNGTGKSHLICWLHNRLVNDPDHENPDKEKVVFLRRLRNTSRGAIQQMLDAGLVQDPELQEKFRKFVSASLSQDEEEFKSTIYHAYLTKVATDRSRTYYKPIKCKEIASFLSDSRVQEYFLSENGPITRCYQTITNGVDPQDGTTKATFEASDFKFPRELEHRIKKDAAVEVSGFYTEELKDDPEAIARLVGYLNHFTSSVIQSCANITSENVRELFENLRRNLKQQGKRLTIFIEDFTSFSIVDSELITALAAEPDGEYHDLCPVTSIIGITDGHYDSFRDNFKDRVFNQINVTERSFCDDGFVLEMAARYLNAIYCEPEQIHAWYESGALPAQLPTADFSPSFDWDSVTLDGHLLTLYPFTKKSLLTMFSRLRERKPRHFLDAVIRQLFRQFAEGMEQGDWYFPELPPNIATVAMNTVYAASVEQSNLSDEDKRRLKVLLAVWGDGTSSARNGCIGSVPARFLSEIGLSSFAGLQESGGETTTTPPDGSDGAGVPPPPPVLSREQLQYQRYMEDIENWFENGAPLRYDDDYFKWLTTFLLHAIPWQDEGIPAHYVSQRRQNGRFVMVEGSAKNISAEAAVAYLEKTPETRTILVGLASYNLYGSWGFENAVYYQSVLITWLERNKAAIKRAICGDCLGNTEQPVITWCLALEYLKRLLNGEVLDTSSDEVLLQQLLGKSSSVGEKPPRENAAWNDVLTHVKNSESVFTQAKQYLLLAANTFMGMAGDNFSKSARIYRFSELKNSLMHLKESNWDLSEELATVHPPAQFELLHKQLKDLYGKIRQALERETALAEKAMSDFSAVLGEEPTEENLMVLCGEIDQFFAQCNHSNQPYRNDLKAKFEGEPQEFAARVRKIYQNVLAAKAQTGTVARLRLFSKDPVRKLNALCFDLHELELLADNSKRQHQVLTGSQSRVHTEASEQAREKLDAALTLLESWEVSE